MESHFKKQDYTTYILFTQYMLWNYRNLGYLEDIDGRDFWVRLICTNFLKFLSCK